MGDGFCQWNATQTGGSRPQWSPIFIQSQRAPMCVMPPPHAAHPHWLLLDLVLPCFGCRPTCTKNATCLSSICWLRWWLATICQCTSLSRWEVHLQGQIPKPVSPLPGLERIQRCFRQCHEPSFVSRASQQSPIAKNRNMGKTDRAYSSFLALDTYCVCTTYVQRMYKSLGQRMPERSRAVGLPFPTRTEQGRGFSIWDAGRLAGCWRAVGGLAGQPNPTDK